MGIRVNPSTAVIASASYIEAEFKASWPEVQVLAQVSFPDVYQVDVVTPVDVAFLEPIKGFADAIGAPVDDVVYEIIKAISDSVSPEDAIAVVKQYIRSFADSVTAPDQPALEPQTPQEDSAATSDDSLLGVGKNLSEGLNLIDNMDGDIEYAFIKVVSELLAAGDIQVIDFSTLKADNILTSSSGVIVMQDYSDITYFSTDYVGDARSFT